MNPFYMTTLNSLSDNELVDLFKSGDQAAYLAIYDRYALTLVNHAYNKTRNREEAKDAVQEVFTNLWAKREKVYFEVNLAGYLYTALRNNILNKIARQGKLDKYVSSISLFITNQEKQIATDYLIREHELSALIEREIAQLTPKMREVFELSRKQHLTHKEISERLNISEQTVSKHVTNALRILRVRLGFFVYLVLILYNK